MKKNHLHFALSGNEMLKQAFAIFILIFTFTTTVNSQPLQLGQSVVTSWTFENNPSYKVVRVIDIRNKPPFIAPGTYWNAPPQYSGANWTKQRMRNVFGIALDDQNPPNIFVSSSSINCSAPDQNDSGLIYRIDGNTWQVTNYTSSTFAPGPPQSGTGIYTMPNTGPRMGNLCYDVHHDQIFATNLEDGVIYRIKDDGFNQGRVEQFFDPSTFPFTPDNRAPGYPPHGDRLWGIGAYGTNTNDVKIYFCRWAVDSYTAGVNEIWSIALNPNGSMNTASLTLEITLPLLPGSPGSNPVSDIEFSNDGDMLLAERSMFGDCSNAHSSRILEYARNITGTYTAYVVHPVGMLINNGSNANSTGGVDFGYGDSDSLTGETSNCDSIIAGTGDYLYLPANGLVYGVQLSNRNPSWINNAQNYSDFIDINNNIVSGGDKTTPGDIDVFTENSCATTCISIVRDTIYCDSTGTYIYEFSVKNNSPTQFLEQLELVVDSPQPPNYVVAIPSSFNINPPIPPNTASGVYRVKLIGPGAAAYAEVCYTLAAQFVNDDCPWCCYIENCIKLPLCNCAEVLKDSLYCVDDQFYYNFTLQNGTQYNITKISVTSPGITPIAFVPQVFHFGTPIQPGQIFPNLTAMMLGGAPGLAIPVKIRLYSDDFECCYLELFYPLPPCDTLHLNLKTFIEGRYIPTSNLMVGDSVEVELRNNFSPYSLVETSKGYLNDSGNCSLKYYYAENGTNYYIVIKHTNSLETWSISPGQVFTGDVLNFDFLSYSQAYGSNLSFIDSFPLWYGIYSGDVDQDGDIDLSDVLLIYNNSNSFMTGNTDLTGDGVTDLSDITIAYNNANNFASIRRP